MNYLSNPVICAIDTKDVYLARTLCEKVQPYVGAVKLGLEFFTMNGNQGLKEIADLGIPIFLDLKFHDIPNTVAQAVRSAVNLNIKILTVHTMGGEKMMRAASEAAKEEAQRLNKEAPIIVGVTVLTSLDGDDLKEVGVVQTVTDQVMQLAHLAEKSALDGIVCSAHEIDMVKKSCGENFKIVVPGIRMPTSCNDDQKRIMTPIKAIDKGADFLVIGRPITQANDPGQAAKKILDEIF